MGLTVHILYKKREEWEYFHLCNGSGKRWDEIMSVKETDYFNTHTGSLVYFRTVANIAELDTIAWSGGSGRYLLRGIRVKKLLFVFCLFFLTSSPFSATDAANQSATPSQTEQCQQLTESGATKEMIAGRGCCSHHSGVCGCSGGRAACCDGSLSPTCGCHKNESPGLPN